MKDEYPRDWKPIFSSPRGAAVPERHEMPEKPAPAHETITAERAERAAAAEVCLAEMLRKRRRNDRIMAAVAVAFVAAGASCAYLVVF